MFDFQAGDAARVDAASAVIVIFILFRKRGAVGVAGNQDMVLLFRPMVEPFFRFVLSCVIFGGAGGVQDTETLQGFPQVADEETGETPKSRVKQVGLVSVGEVKIHGRSGISR